MRHSVFMNFGGLLAVAVVAASSLGAAEPETTTLAEQRLQKIVGDEQEFIRAYERNPQQFSDGDLQRHILSHLSAYSEYIRDYPEDVYAIILYAKLLRRAGEDDHAFKAFLKADSLDPKLAVVKQQISTYLAEKEKPLAALPFCIQAIELEPETAAYHFQLGQLLAAFRDEFVDNEIYTHDAIDRQMIAAFKRAADLEPDNFDFRMRLGEAYYDLHTPDWKNAYVTWRKLRTGTDDFTRLQIIDLHRARVLVELGRNEEARALLENIDEPMLEHSKQLVLEKLK